MQLILASSSPRRQQMLRMFGLSLKVCPPGIKEIRFHGEPPIKYAKRLAVLKAKEVAKKISTQKKDSIVLAADTIVVLKNKVLEKPKNQAQALKMLCQLSGKTHTVVTAYCWLGFQLGQQKLLVNVVQTEVSFSTRPKEFWEWYVSTGEPLDKAGGYAAQGIGMSFIESVNGSYSNVVGLPLSQILEDFKKLFEFDLYEYSRKIC